jgi:hypothetical protein
LLKLQKKRAVLKPGLSIRTSLGYLEQVIYLPLKLIAIPKTDDLCFVIIGAGVSEIVSGEGLFDHHGIQEIGRI